MRNIPRRRRGGRGRNPLPRANKRPPEIGRKGRRAAGSARYHIRLVILNATFFYLALKSIRSRAISSRNFLALIYSFFALNVAVNSRPRTVYRPRGGYSYERVGFVKAEVVYPPSSPSRLQMRFPLAVHIFFNNDRNSNFRLY